jgi:hypothetical protein
MGLDGVAVFVVALLFFESIVYLFWRKHSKRKVQHLDRDIVIKEDRTN